LEDLKIFGPTEGIPILTYWWGLHGQMSLREQCWR